MENRNRENGRKLYEVIFALLALVAVVIACVDIAGSIHLEDSPELYALDRGILYLFVADYFIRFFLAEEKKSL